MAGPYGDSAVVVDDMLMLVGLYDLPAAGRGGARQLEARVVDSGDLALGSVPRAVLTPERAQAWACDPAPP